MGRAVNVGTGIGHSVSDVIASAGRAVGFGGAVLAEGTRMRPGERAVVVADPAVLRALTGWAPRFTLDAAIVKLISDAGTGSKG